MRTDTIFFQLFQTFEGLMFELVGLPPETAAGYRFTSVEIKEKAFRFDGIFIPDSVDKNMSIKIYEAYDDFIQCVIPSEQILWLDYTKMKDPKNYWIDLVNFLLRTSSV
jgi:predicted transposase YdaD